jgi:pimeloyl-ACP methyl ester carboxylesterase
MGKDPMGRSSTATGFAIAVGAAAVAGAIALATLTVVVARKVVTPSKKRVEDIRILGFRDGAVTLSATLDSLLPGTYSLWFSEGSGHAKIGRILEIGPTWVRREVLAIDYGELGEAARGYVAGWVYLGPDELELPFEDVVVDAPSGPAPAWLIPAPSSDRGSGGRWLIGVHGRGVRRQECLRAVDVASRCGYTSLLVSYRNDGDAQPSNDGRYGLGDTEWPDIEAAIDFAVEHGATEIVLMGWSMGGAISLQIATRSSRAALVKGLILESPVINWTETLHFQADALHIPYPVRTAATNLLSAGWGAPLVGIDEPIALNRLDFVARANDLDLPILLLHSVDDGYVPAGSSRALAEARPDIVTYEEFTVARHTKLWNYDPERWNAAIGAWLSRLD